MTKGSKEGNEQSGEDTPDAIKLIGQAVVDPNRHPPGRLPNLKILRKMIHGYEIRGRETAEVQQELLRWTEKNQWCADNRKKNERESLTTVVLHAVPGAATLIGVLARYRQGRQRGTLDRKTEYVAGIMEWEPE